MVLGDCSSVEGVLHTNTQTNTTHKKTYAPITTTLITITSPATTTHITHHSPTTLTSHLPAALTECGVGCAVCAVCARAT